MTQSNESDMKVFPRSIAERAASDIRQYAEPDRGGHFLALEEPQLVAEQLSTFMRSWRATARASRCKWLLSVSKTKEIWPLRARRSAVEADPARSP